MSASTLNPTCVLLLAAGVPACVGDCTDSLSECIEDYEERGFSVACEEVGEVQWIVYGDRLGCDASDASSHVARVEGVGQSRVWEIAFEDGEDIPLVDLSYLTSAVTFSTDDPLELTGDTPFPDVLEWDVWMRVWWADWAEGTSDDAEIEFDSPVYPSMLGGREPIRGEFSFRGGEYIDRSEDGERVFRDDSARGVGCFNVRTVPGD